MARKRKRLPEVAAQTLGVVALNILVCSGLSMFISAVCMDQDKAVTAGIVVMVPRAPAYNAKSNP